MNTLKPAVFAIATALASAAASADPSADRPKEQVHDGERPAFELSEA